MDLSRITTSELLVILDVSRRLAERRLVQPLIEYVSKSLFELIPAERCLIVLFDAGGQLNVRIASDRQGRPLSDVDDQISHSVFERVRVSMTPLIVDDAQADRALQSARSVRSLGLRSVMCVPLISYGAVIGAIYVENRSARGRFREESLVPLVLFSSQVVVALENARAYEALEATIAERTAALQAANAQLAEQAAALHELSMRDVLTGLHNRRYFSEIMPSQFEIARRYQRPLSLVYIDIDNFKQINDTFLHTGGDQVLVALAKILQANLRAADHVARIGGEEFAIIMPESTLAAAQLTCERLRTLIAQYRWDELAPGLAVTVSIGVAESAGRADHHALMRAADEHLYAAKRLGKNQVVVSAPRDQA